MKNIYAIILARGGSKRVPKKNLKKIDQIPLVGHAIIQAKNSSYINQIIVSTDDSEIGKVSRNYGARIVDRPEHLKNDNTIMEADNILCQVTEDLEARGEKIDIIVLLYPTAPLRKTIKIDEAIELVLNQNYDSALSLVEDQGYFWRKKSNKEKLIPFNYDPKKRMPSVMHDFKQFKENKAIYVSTRDLLINTGCRLGGKIGYVLMNTLESVDVDTKEDLELCKILYKRNKSKI
jgi:CMP-N,N'-diacetyllegionaminic acid synthase